MPYGAGKAFDLRVTERRGWRMPKYIHIAIGLTIAIIQGNEFIDIEMRLGLNGVLQKAVGLL